jgi:archaellum component FlaC
MTASHAALIQQKDAEISRLAERVKSQEAVVNNLSREFEFVMQ